MDQVDQQTAPTVVVVGGGYGGVRVAKALDETAQVILVEPRDAFMHNIAALRALVDPSWLSRIFFPYDKVLANGRVVHDRATLVEPNRVVTSSGEEIAADYVVLATGSSYPFPAKTDLVDTEAAHQQVRATHESLSKAERVLLLGAGPVGIELAGEIKAVWPDKSVTLLDLAGELLGGPFKAELKAELRRQLEEIGVEILLGSPLQNDPSTEPGELGTFTVSTEGGTTVTADIWFRCYGVIPNSDYLGKDLLAARGPDGFVAVGPTLQIAGHDHVFAIGDLSSADAKMAAFAGMQAETVANNINALMAGKPASELASYQPIGPAMVVPIGPLGGAGQFPGQDDILGAEAVSDMKGKEMGIDRFAELFGLAVAAE
jgi:NADH dehydrogenase FAD-containing subunit